MNDVSSNISVDITEVRDLVKGLTSKELKRAVGNATKRAAAPVVAQTKANFLALNSGTSGGRSGRLGGLRVREVRRRRGAYVMAGRNLPVVVEKTFWQKTDNPFTTATIRTRNNKTDFRALFFERGTKLRHTKKGYNRGRIIAGRYFSKAVKEKEPEVQRSMRVEILQALNKKIKP